jgi:glycosyltransferase involved in cell wall biosynthesis
MSGRRIVLVTDEILGAVRNAGAGTANTFLAFALAELGHRVEILLTVPPNSRGLERSWAKQYASRAIEIRTVEQLRDRVTPAFRATYAVQDSLARDPPEIVVAHDCFGPAYAALRSRHLGLGFANTMFAIYCHGTTGWIYEAHRKLRRWPTSFELQALERAAVELADVVVSPSAYMLEWMRSRGWDLGRSIVAPYFTQASAERQAVEKVPLQDRLRRIVFFGRLEERKGIGQFVAALNELDTNHLRGVEVVFLGKETPLWPIARVEDSISDSVRRHVASLRFESRLDHLDAISLLKQPGTLAVMPSLVDNSPNVIYECLEHGISFLASNAGGGPELIAEEDRAPVLIEPTVAGIHAGLDRILAEPSGLAPVRASFDSDQLLSTWEEAIASTNSADGEKRSMEGRVSAVVRGSGSSRTRESLAHQTRRPDEIVDDLRKATGDHVLVLEDQDVLDSDCLATLLTAAGTGADVVTCGVRCEAGTAQETYLFVGEPRELGVIGNYYGLIGLYRRSALEGVEIPTRTEGDADWVLLATLSLAGARIVSVPRPLAFCKRFPGSAARDPVGSSAGFSVVRAFERANPVLHDLPWLAASLAARRIDTPSPSLTQRARWILGHEGAVGLARRGFVRASQVAGRNGSTRLRRFRQLRRVEPNRIDTSESSGSRGT